MFKFQTLKEQCPWHCWGNKVCGTSRAAPQVQCSAYCRGIPLHL